MIHIVIRTCERDDYLAALCYESFKSAGIEANYSFLAEPGNYKYISNTEIPINSKSFCDNYGGQFGAKSLVKEFQQYTVDEDDFFIFSDSDIVVLKDFTNDIKDFDHSGIMCHDVSKLKHISGQMQIFSWFVFNKIKSLTDGQIDEIIQQMNSRNISIADDTFVSFLTDTLNLKKQNVSGRWYHNKFYQYADSKMTIQEVLHFLKYEFKP